MHTHRILTPVSTRHALRWRLPALISGLIALVLATFLFTAYRGVEATLRRAASERAQAAADQISGLLDGRRATAQLQQVSADPDLRRFLQLRTGDARTAAHARLAVLASGGSRRVELWDAAGTRLIEITAPGPPGAAARVPPPGAPPSGAGIGALQAAPDAVVFSDVVAEIRGADPGAPAASPLRRLGYVRIRATLVENPPGIFSRLVGPGAGVWIANRQGQTWTDLRHFVAAGAVDLTRRGVNTYRGADGRTRLGAVSLVPDTPWAVWVEFPLDAVIAPARLFLNGMLLVALIFVAGAAVLATMLAARITRPLSEINTAATAMAAGDYSTRVKADRPDEIGRLARTFNVMAADVEATSEALKQSETRYRHLFASNPHPMWVYDVETLRFLDVNDMAISRYGYSRDEFLGMTIKDLRPASELPALADNTSRVAPTVERSGIWKHRKKDGTCIDVDVSSHELRLEGRAARVVLAHDVTARLAAEAALRESEALFRGMAETMPHIVWTAGADGQFSYLNHQWFEYTGLSIEETQRHSWQTAIHPDDRAQTIEVRTRALQAGDPYEVAYRLRRARDAAYRWHLGRAAPLRNDGGAIVMWVGTITDVDDARRAADELKVLNAELEERVLARTADLELANKELESFSYSVSHDLRAPLRHVQGYVEMLTTSIEGQLSETSRRYLKTITDAATEMGDLIDDLLAFSRTARVQMSEGQVPLDDVVRDAVRGLEMAVRGRDIRWSLGPLPVVMGDPSMLKQVFANLLGNAVKYTRGREPAHVEVGCAGEEEGRQIVFVRDNGAGFDMRYAHKLFGVFQRLHRADEFEGTGIGLATVRRIISRHGGRTWAEGQVNAGATFYVTLTAAPTPQIPMEKDGDEFTQTHSAGRRQPA